MTMPRQVLPGRSYLITRSTRNRRFFLAPTDTAVNLIFRYCLACAAALASVKVHTFCVMSNHVHIVVTDVKGNLPIFTQWLFRHTALCLKKLRDIPENVWATDRVSVVELLTEEALLEAIAYVIANPASADLVRYSRSWPGAVSRPEDLRGLDLEVEPPPVYFKEAKPAVLRTTAPEALVVGKPVEAVVESVRHLVKGYEQEAAASRRERGVGVVGCRKLAKVSHDARPQGPRRQEKTSEKGAPRRVPRFKALCREALKAARKRLREFWEAYREALEAFRQKKSSVFPAGTWWYRVFLNLPTAPVEVASALS